MEEIGWTDRLKNEVLHRVKEENNNLRTIKKVGLLDLVTFCVRTAF